jgi:hypothetical protein
LRIAALPLGPSLTVNHQFASQNEVSFPRRHKRNKRQVFLLFVPGRKEKRCSSALPAETSRANAVATGMIRIHAFRVLLTHARQGMVIVVPEGNSRDPEFYDSTFSYLADIGFKIL